MLVDHPASGLEFPVPALAVRGVPAAARVILCIAEAASVISTFDPVGAVLWQARHSALRELSIARNFGLFGSMFCT